jgi:methylase of polypeptide subunit release factors
MKSTQEQGEAVLARSMLEKAIVTSVCRFCLVGAALLSAQYCQAAAVEASSLEQLYRQARHVRTTEGHAAAVPLYQSIVREYNPSDRTAASRIAACSVSGVHHENLCREPDADKLFALRSLLYRSRFTARAIASLFGITSSDHKLFHASCPIYLTPSSAGVTTVPSLDCGTNDANVLPIKSLATLFLLGLAVPREALALALTPEGVQILQDLHLIAPCEIDSNLLVPYAQIFPIDLQSDRTLYIVTDWHPRVLSTTKVGTCSDVSNAVMYIGPDSLALVQHWLQSSRIPSCGSLLDLCTGSGVQALAALTMEKANQAVCVDLNPRALQMTRLNAILNDLDTKVQCVLGDLTSDVGRIYTNSEGSHDLAIDDKAQPLLDVLRRISPRFDLITANPPFLPVPPEITQARHGLFSAGGPSGEAVLASIVQLSSSLLSNTGFLAIVSEFFLKSVEAAYVAPCSVSSRGSEESANEPGVPSSPEVLLDSNFDLLPQHDALDRPADELLSRIESWWNNNQHDPKHDLSSVVASSTTSIATTCSSTRARGLLLTNEYPITADLYAERRADNAEEFAIWQRHLQSLEIGACSPGFFILQKMHPAVDGEVPASSCFAHQTVPQTSWGSLWTPSNPQAVAYTNRVLSDFFTRPNLEEG